MNARKHDELKAAIAAADWLETLKTGDTAQRIAFAEWLLQTPLNVRQFLLLTAFERELEHFTPTPPPSQHAPEASRLLPSAGATPASDLQAPSAPPRIWKQLRMLAVAAVALLTLGGIVLYSLGTANRGPTQYITGIAEQRTIPLEDGSQIEVNAASYVEVDYSNRARNVRLVRGEALFNVAHDPDRPFEVRHGDTVVRAVGTQFNVDVLAQGRSQRLSVAVLEGRVRISSGDGFVDADMGEIVQVDDGHLKQPRRGDVFGAAAWKEGRLVFDRTPLASVAARFNRHNRSPTLEVDAALADRPLTASIRSTDPQLLLQVLSSNPDIIVESRADRVIIRKRRDGE